MLSSRHIHFAILGLIIGAAGGYIFAFYQAQSAFSSSETISAGAGTAPTHPDIDEAQMVEMLRQAAEANPDQPELLIRYANVLFNMGRLEEAVQWYARIIALEPDNLDVRSLRGAVLWRLGQPDEAMKDLEAALAIDANHIPSLHGLFLITVDNSDVAAAGELLRKIEALDPAYPGLDMIRGRLEEERSKAAN